MKIFITGVTGFLGDKLSDRLFKSGHEIGCYVRNISAGDKAENTEDMILGNKRSGMSLYFGDVTDFVAIRNSLREFQPDVVVHLASQTSVAYSFTHPFEVAQTNFIGTMNIVEAAREVMPDLKRFIWSGTAEEYGNQDEFPIKETSPLRAASPYGVTKIAAEKYLKYLFDAYDFPVTMFRNTNSYGRLNNHQFVIESMIFQMLNDTKIARFGDPEPIRDFLYSDDLLEAYVQAIESTSENLNGESINVSTGLGISIRDLANKISQKTNYKGEIKWDCFPKRAMEIKNLTMDNTKVKRIMNWEPKDSLDSGLDKTIKWWQSKLIQQ